MKKQIVTTFSVIILLTLLSCQNSSTGPSGEKNGMLNLSLDLAKAPNTVMQLTGFLAHAQHDTIILAFEVTNNIATCTVENITPGNWMLTVNALDKDEFIIYKGTTTVSVNAGENTVVDLILDPVYGGITINVSWEEKEKILLMAQNQNEEWRILSLNLDGTGLRDIVAGTYGFWINNAYEIYYYVDVPHSLYKINLYTNQTELLSYVPNSINFLRFSEALNSIIFDLRITQPVWDLGSMDMNFNNYQVVFQENSYKKRPVTKRNSKWIYFISDISGIYQIYRYNPESFLKEQFIIDDLICEFPSFSYDDAKMLYTKRDAASSVFQIISRDLESQEETIIDFSNLGQPLYPVFTKTGEYIVYGLVVGPEFRDRALYRMKADGTEKIRLLSNDQYNYFARPLTW